jgi:hypothetical protein
MSIYAQQYPDAYAAGLTGQPLPEQYRGAEITGPDEPTVKARAHTAWSEGASERTRLDILEHGTEHVIAAARQAAAARRADPAEPQVNRHRDARPAQRASLPAHDRLVCRADQ